MVEYDNIKYFDEPIYKKLTEIQQGDVIYTEFGDYDNYIQAIFDNFEKTKPNISKISFHYSDGRFDEMYGFSNIDTTEYKIIGKEIQKWQKKSMKIPIIQQ